MKVLPAIDLREGACVQLVGGEYSDEKIRLPDPVAVARRWQRDGFDEIHVVDLDAATRRGSNTAAVEAIAGTGIRFQLGGGLSTEESIDLALRLGANRVIVGTKAIEDREWLIAMAERFPGKLVVAADVRDRSVVTRGWSSDTGRDIAEVVGSLDSLPLAGLLVTAVHVEGKMEGPDVELIRSILPVTRHPIQASGGITSLADLRNLAAVGASAAVVGMAFYTGRLEPSAVAREFIS